MKNYLTSYTLNAACFFTKARFAALSVLLCCVWSGVMGQVEGNKYKSFYDEIETSSKTIQHKQKTKWHDIRNTLNLSVSAKNLDSFDDDIKVFKTGDDSIQAAHTYIDTIYMYKGSSVLLELPTTTNNSNVSDYTSTGSYQRWYNFKNDATFRTKKIWENSIWDLLTPVSDRDCYRFTNGYVGHPLPSGKDDKHLFYSLNRMNFYYPTDETYNNLFGDGTANSQNQWHIVACDVSCYKDYAADYKNGQNSAFLSKDRDPHEPTLSHRVLFYIIGVDENSKDVSSNKGHQCLTTNDYQTNGTKYLEEYDITFPAKHVSNNTDELVVLAKDARSYAIPGLSKDDDTVGKLDVSIKSDNLELVTTSLSTASNSMDRIIKFKAKSNFCNDKQWEVPDGSQATIFVTKTVEGITYHIARYRLTFKKTSDPLTQSQVARLSDLNFKDLYKDYLHRSPVFMKSNLNMLTELSWEYDQNTAKLAEQNTHIKSGYYPFPMAWNYSSYAFYDGSPDRNSTSGITEWGQYSIVDKYVGYGDGGNDKDGDTLTNSKEKGSYFMYVDVSDRPGTIARIPFEKNLCKGSELIVSAWMKSASENDDASLLFTVVGVKGTVQVPIYRHASGQIRRTTYLPGKKGEGMGKGTNQWFQIYFSFVNSSVGDYDSYYLQVDNNSASSQGGDLYLDEIKVFLMNPSAELTQLEATCLGQSTLMSMELDWERLSSRLGLKERDSGMDAIDFCFIDEMKYHALFEQKKKELEQSANPPQNIEKEACRYAIENSIVQISPYENKDGAVQENGAIKYGTIWFNKSFNLNNDYRKGETLIQPNGKKSYFFKADDPKKGKRLAVDFYSTLQPYRPYLMLISPSMNGKQATAESFTGFNNDDCAIKTSFYVESTTLLKMNGEVVDPLRTYCVGNIFNFSPEVRIAIEDKTTGQLTYKYVKDVYFDWFMGTMDEFQQEQIIPGQAGASNLNVALTNFRADHPNSSVLVEPASTDKHYEAIHYEILKMFSERLILYKKSLDLPINEKGLQMVIKPIEKLGKPGDFGFTDEQWKKVCWEAIPVFLKADPTAPEAYLGFGNIKYPDNVVSPKIRVGLKQLVTAKDIPIKVSLRNLKPTSDGGTLGMASKMAYADYTKLYLTATNDPQYADQLQNSMDPLALPVGSVQEFEQQKNTDDGYASVLFDGPPHFSPKEGCYYICTMYFEEKAAQGGKGGEEGEELSNICRGQIPMTIIVVPEYLKWVGNDKSNWNNDGNWVRASKNDLHKAQDYVDNDEVVVSPNIKQPSTGYVPMIFSNVILPQNSKTELYKAGFDKEGVWVSEKPVTMGNPTADIQYDLLVYNRPVSVNVSASMTTEQFRVDLCNSIHFCEGAQLKPMEQLLYADRVYGDIAMPLKQWTLMASPWKSEVAGDWYSDTNGKQHERELFVPVTFDKNCDRYVAEVFQRSWDANAKMIEGSTNKTVSFQSLWSTAYNDAAVVHTPGLGYSMKAYLGNTGGSMYFRMPKDDKSYRVSSAHFDKAETGKLKVSELLTRRTPIDQPNNEDFTGQKQDWTVELQPVLDLSNNKFYIVGNPFMAHLNLAEFFKENASVLEQKYWTADNHGPQAGVAQDGKWTTVDGTSVAQIKPYGAFFVQLQPNVPQPVKIKFTSAMQEFEKAPAAAAAFSVTAKGKAGRSSAAVAFVENATDGADAEDAELLQDDQLYPKVPLVYTVAGDRAVSVNHCSGLRMIPLGVFADDGESVTLSFNGTACLGELELFDAETRESVKLDDDYTFEITGPSHGRYFLRTSGEATGVDEAVRKGDVNIYSVVRGQVVVAAERGIRKVEVFNLGGERLAAETPADDVTCRIDGLAKGVAIVRVTTTDGITVKKVNIK